MTITCPNPACSQHIEITPAQAGVVANCPTCGVSMQLPSIVEFPNPGLPAAPRRQPSAVKQPHQILQDDFSRPLDVMQWLAILFLMMVPFVNLVMLIIWAFSPNLSRRNFARAYLLMTLFFVIVVFSFVILTSR
jgi:uncharacterized membrane protein YfhO